ncbi:MAG TPA: hypothetical protein VHV09_02270 [Trebonia sp.]|jgi:hypothetical protein|nr:hypothetical protein [Trebonia sp.]
MHPELLTRLALERPREIAASRPAAQPAAAPRHARRPALPFRVTWSRTTLAPAADRRRGRSVVVVISATRLL